MMLGINISLKKLVLLDIQKYFSLEYLNAMIVMVTHNNLFVT